MDPRTAEFAPETTETTVSMDMVIEAVRLDSLLSTMQYLSEVVTPLGGE